MTYRTASAFDPTAREEAREEAEEGYPESRPLVPNKVRGKPNPPGLLDRIELR